MRTRISRHLGAFFSPPAVAAAQARFGQALDKAVPAVPAITIPPEFSPHQYAILLLHIAAEIEHALMVEYLYAAYALGGPQVPEDQRQFVTCWQEVVAGIAKEEMGHLMTVQNLLRGLGGPLNLDREDYPWDSGFLPFPFSLEPLNLASLSRFIVAESPANWCGPMADEIRKQAQEGLASDVKLHRVGELYELIHDLIADPNLILDSDFRATTLPYQANWDEWGRGYKGGSRGNTTGGSPKGTPDVLLLPVTSRTEALAAIKAISTQGEACPDDNEDAPSHFARFMGIYNQFPKMENWASRPAPQNPIVATDFTGEGEDVTPITDPEAKLWATLFNVRYQMLLTSLLHTFDYPSNLDASSQMTPRGLLIHATFGEMYNLRAIAMLLVQTPLHPGDSLNVAGPPFQMPYTLDLPLDDVDRWRVHLDLFQSAGCLICDLLDTAPAARHTYLQALREGDSRNAAAIREMLNCQTHLSMMHTHR